MVNLTQALAEEWAPHGVRVNCVNPERTRTPMRERAFGEEPAQSLLLSEDVASTVLPGDGGYFGVLANHAPLIGSLGIGVLEYRDEGGEVKLAALHEGFAEMLDNHLIVLANHAELGEDIDQQRALDARKRAEERIRSQKADIDIERAQAALRRAAARLRASGQG